MTKTTITRKLAVPTDRAWEAVRSFGQLDVWFPTMETCTVEGSGVGAVRRLSLIAGFGNITDRLVALDAEARRRTRPSAQVWRAWTPT